MKVRDLFDHYGVIGNPFAEEDAQNDDVFKRFCVKNSFHSAWDKIYGNPSEPSTSIVFGEKGAGKTALRLQMIKMLTEYNTEHPVNRPLVVDYSDLNPFIDRFKQRFSRRKKIIKILNQYELWDHLDAILSLATTQLIDRILPNGQPLHPAAVDVKPLPITELNEFQARDLLLLAACYDMSRSETQISRWKKLARKLHYWTVSHLWSFVLGFGTGLCIWSITRNICRNWDIPVWLMSIVFLLCVLPLFLRESRRVWKALSLRKSLRVLSLTNPYAILTGLRNQDFDGMPFPVKGNTDNRYEMLHKLLGVMQPLGFNGLIVILDRLDEPYLINGNADLMKRVIWPIFDNKLLKHDRVGIKMLLPNQLLPFIDKENAEFHQRARLDKQNLVRSLDWTGESLFDLTNIRLKAVVAEGIPKEPQITDFFADSIDRKRLIDVFAKLKVPRHLFRFLYSLFASHVNAYTDTEPEWKISAATFESVLSLYLRENFR